MPEPSNDGLPPDSPDRIHQEEKKTTKLENLISRPHVIKGNPDDIVDIHWGFDHSLPRTEKIYD
ncbi:hypothetical protein EPICR_170029 [Candidatus Desulfarcum epimagneticum]|uniref:Uncharacterized protein n=1 Tax=uncultured Desulfobacteraceae bacterium TaxID=218296 RepID=A0A484HFF2_9BACT|nr:hypothetical protein EPICR_170029 [uncultured Desulfobacteraceae bacterium]